SASGWICDRGLRLERDRGARDHKGSQVQKSPGLMHGGRGQWGLSSHRRRAARGGAWGGLYPGRPLAAATTPKREGWFILGRRNNAEAAGLFHLGLRPQWVGYAIRSWFCRGWKRRAYPNSPKARRRGPKRRRRIWPRGNCGHDDRI